MGTRATKIKAINQKKLPGISSIVTSGLLLFIMVKALRKNGIKWRPGRLAAFLLIGEQESFTIAACRTLFAYSAYTFFPKVVKYFEEVGYVVKIGKVANGRRPRILYALSHTGRQLHAKIYRTMMRYAAEHYKGHKTKSRVI